MNPFYLIFFLKVKFRHVLQFATYFTISAPKEMMSTYFLNNDA